MVKIACIGNITYDIIAYTNSYPIENTRCNYNNIINSFGGPAANAAYLLDKYGMDVDLYGIIGNDTFSKIVNKELSKTNINTENILKSQNMNIPLSYVIVTDDKKTRTINSYRSKSDNKNITFNNYKNDYDIILTDGKYPKATLELIKKNPNAITVIDAGRCNSSTIDLCKYIDIIISSEDFVNDYIKLKNYDLKINIKNIKETNRIMNILKKDYNNNTIITTIGKDGYLYYDENENLVHNNSLNYGKVVDTTGAGDIFHGAFIYALASNKSLEECLEFANKVSSISVTKYGAKSSIPELEEVKEKIYKNVRR